MPVATSRQVLLLSDLHERKYGSFIDIRALEFMLSVLLKTPTAQKELANNAEFGPSHPVSPYVGLPALPL